MDESRQNACRAALLAPVDGQFRPMTAASVCVLSMLKNPLAALSEEALESASELDIMVFAWAHSAPMAEVRRRVVECRLMPAALLEHVLAWAEKQSPDFFTAAYAHVVTEIQHVAAGMAIHTHPSKSKNGPGQSGSSPSPFWPANRGVARFNQFFSKCLSVFWSKSLMPPPVSKAAK